MPEELLEITDDMTPSDVAYLIELELPSIGFLNLRLRIQAFQFIACRLECYRRVGGDFESSLEILVAYCKPAKKACAQAFIIRDRFGVGDLDIAGRLILGI